MNKLITLTVLFGLSFIDLYSQTTQLDDNGNLQVLGVNGELLEYHLLDSKGITRPPPALAKRIYQYDSLLNRVSESYHQSNGKLYQYPSGVAKRKFTYNYANKEVIMECYDSSNNRTTDKTIGASITYKRYFSQTGRVAEIIYLGTDSTKVNNLEGHAREVFQYEPFIVVSSYDDKDILVQYVTNEIKYIMNLQLLWSSIPRWLRNARQNNKVDGVHFKSFRYDLTLANQSFDGMIQYNVKLKNGDINEISCSKSDNVTEKKISKTTRALKKAYFLSLSAIPHHTVEGQIYVYFKSPN